MLKLDLIVKIVNQIDYFQKEKIRKVLELVKDDLDGNIMTKFVGLRAKTYSYLIDNSSEDKKAKSTKNVLKKKTIAIENSNLRIIKSNLFRSD